MVAAIRDPILAVIKPLSALILIAAFAASAAYAQTPAPIGFPTAAPIGFPTAAPTAPPLTAPTVAPTASPVAAGTSEPGVAAPAPKPPSNLVTYTGQLLDYRNNYVYFTTGDAFPAIELPRIVDALTGQPTTIAPRAKMFARVTFDPATKKIIELAITNRRMQTSETLGPATAFVVVGSTPVPAPEIAGQNLTGKQVAVVFEVTVPPTTAFTDTIYISTDSSQWNPTAIRLDRVDAYKYRALRYFASGTKFAYRVTRGSWNSVERGEDNLDAPPHQFFVREVDSLAARVTVYHWSDERGQNIGSGPNSIPTPYNPSPFTNPNNNGLPAYPGAKTFPTPAPGHQ